MNRLPAAAIAFLLSGLLSLPAAGSAQPSALPDLVSEALEHNREVLSAKAGWQAAAQVPPQAAALPDPKLSLGVMNLPTSFSFSADMMTMKQVQLSQMFPWLGKRGLRGEVASQEAEAARQRYLETANRVARDVKDTYFELYYTGRQGRLVEANLAALTQFVDVAKAAYVSGMGTQADMLRAQTAHTRMLDDRFMVEQERTTILARLAGLLSRPLDTEFPEPAEPPRTEPPSWQPEELLKLALERRPMLKESEAMVAARRRDVALARKDYYPDLEVMASYGQRNEIMGQKIDDMVAAAVAINLPVWRSNKLAPRLRETLSAEDQATEMYQSGVNELRASLAGALAKARRAKETVSLYDTGILPQARLTVESSLASYRVGKLDFLSLLDAQMNLYNSEVARARALTDYLQAVAEIDYVIGAPPLEAAK